MKERLLLGEGAEHELSSRRDFDPIAEGNRYGLTPEASAVIWDRARRDATDRHGACDEDLARQRFVQLAQEIAERGGLLHPEPFHWTELDAASGSIPTSSALATPEPGKTTQVLTRASRRASVPLGLDPGRTTLLAGHTGSDVCTPDESRGSSSAT